MMRSKFNKSLISGFLLLVLLLSCNLDNDSKSYSKSKNKSKVKPTYPVKELEITGTSYHVTTEGTRYGDGSEENPWDLKSAISGEKGIYPGDAILIHGGVYKGIFHCRLNGSSTKPIIIKPYGSDRVVLDAAGNDDDGVLILDGDNLIAFGLQMTNSHPNRIDTDPKTLPRTRGVYIKKPNCKVINCLVYDNNQSAVAIFAQAHQTEFYGNIVYNNGSIQVDTPAGHGLYSQSSTGYQTIEDNIFFNSMMYGFHIYTEGGSIKGFRIKGNILFNSGALGGSEHNKTNMLIGGKGKPGEDIIVTENHFYHGIENGKNVELGYKGNNKDFIFKNNYITGGSSGLIVLNWEEVTVTNNRIAGRNFLTMYDDQTQIPLYKEWDFNNYYQIISKEIPFIKNNIGLSWNSWLVDTGFDKNSLYQNGMPTSNEVIIRPNKYEKGRAHLIVYNWENKSSIDIDPSYITPVGESIYIYDVENIPMGPIKYIKEYKGGIITIDINQALAVKPFGNLAYSPEHTGKDFGTYLIRSNPI